MGRTSTRWVAAAALAGACLFLISTSGNAQTFGQNRVPGPTRTWRVLTSEHIALHFHDDEREVARSALRIAERAYARSYRVHGQGPKERIPVLLYSSPGEFSETPVSDSPLGEGIGGLTESFKRRVLVPATGSIAELDHVLSHEIEHAFQMDMLQGGGAGAQAMRWWPPDWVMEGLAEYVSVPGLDVDTEMWLRDAVLNGTLIDLETLAYVGDMRVYRFGQTVPVFLAERFGDDAVGLWWRAMVRRHNLERGTSESIGLTLEKLSEEWQAWARKRYLPSLGARPEPGEVERQLTRHRQTLANFYVAPAVSPDGSELIYVADEAPYPDIFLASAIDGSHVRRIIRGARQETFESVRFFRSAIDWHPDGDRLALIARSGGKDRLTVFNVRRRETEASYTFDLEEMLSPVWSPDGRTLVFVGTRGGLSRLYRVGADGKGLVALTSGEWAALQPAMSPDGRWIAYTTDRGHVTWSPGAGASPWRIAILDLASGVDSLLPNTAGKNINPQWFPDGQHLLYVSDRTGISNLFVRDLLSGSDYALTDFANGVSGITPSSPTVSLSDDGHRLAFNAYSASGWDLFAMKDPLARIAGLSPWLPPAPAPPAADAFPADPSRANSLAWVGLPRVTLVTPALDDSLAAVAAALGEARARADSLASTPAAPLPEPARADSLTAGVVAHSEPGGEAFPAPPDAVEFTGPPLPGEPGRPEPLGPIESISLADLFDETRAVPESSAVSEGPYRPRLSVDYVEAGGLYATGFGAIATSYVALSDILGNRQLLLGLDVNGSLEEGNYYLAYLNQRRRLGLSVAAYQYMSGYGYSSAPGYPDVYVKRLVRGVGIGTQYPLSHFRRLEFYVDAVYERRFHWSCEELSSLNLWRCGWEDESTGRTYVVPEIAYVHDSALFGSTGPLSGRRARISAGTYIGDREAYGLEADWRFYWNVRKRYAVAARTVFAGEWGPDRELMAFGGPYSVRGFTEEPLYGTSLIFTNLEFRFPFIEDLHIAWPLQLGFSGIRGALFCDLGAGWTDREKFKPFHTGDDGFRLEDLHASCGFRAAINLGFTVLRWDLARKTDFSQWLGKAKGEVSIGWEF
jgi:hypothetical protein